MKYQALIQENEQLRERNAELEAAKPAVLQARIDELLVSLADVSHERDDLRSKVRWYERKACSLSGALRAHADDLEVIP